MPEDLSPDGRTLRRDGMRRLEQEPNVHVKLSGLGTFLRRNDPAHIREVVSETLSVFGPDRCLWGSNFPIGKIWTDYGAIVVAIEPALADAAPGDRDRTMAGNAMRLYRLDRRAQQACAFRLRPFDVEAGRAGRQRPSRWRRDRQTPSRLVHFFSKSLRANWSTMKSTKDLTLAERCFRLG